MKKYTKRCVGLMSIAHDFNNEYGSKLQVLLMWNFFQFQ